MSDPVDDEDVFYIKQGDLEPPLFIAVGGVDGDLSGVADWEVVGYDDDGELFRDTGAQFIAGATPQVGSVKHVWAAGETDNLGSMYVEVSAIWPGDRRQTFPPRNHCRVVVSKHLP